MRGLALLPLLALTACATGYQSTGLAGGFEEVALAPNIYRVSFNGNGYTSTQRAEEMALLRSADLTLQKGYRFFALADSQNDRAVSSFTTPQQSTTNFQAQAYGNTAYGTAQTTTYGGQTFFVSKPSSSNLVVMFADKPDGTLSFDAAFLCTSIGAKYKVTCGAK